MAAAWTAATVGRKMSSSHKIRARPKARQAGPGLTRRQFIGRTAAAVAAFNLVPRHVLGGPKFVAPSEKITLAYIGCGTQGLREMPAMLAMPEI